MARFGRSFPVPQRQRAISTIVNANVTQVAAVVTAAGGTQTVAATVIASAAITQVAATITATGGTQVVATVRKVALAQIAANVTATGGTQSVVGSSVSNFVTLKSGVGFAEEWSPTTNPADSPVYVSIGGSTRNATINRGRDRELDRFQAGRSTSLLDNRTRAFDPTYAAGPNFGNILPERRTRKRAQYPPVTGTIYPLYTGFYDGFPQSWDIGNTEATVSSSATDAFKILNGVTLPTSMFEMVAKTICSWDHWWKMDDGAGAQVVLDSGTIKVNGQPRNVTFGSGNILAFDGGRSTASFELAPNLTGISIGYNASAAGSMNVAVSEGLAYFDSVLVDFAGQTVTLASADLAFGTSRFDLVSAASDGTVNVTQGVPQVFFPTVPNTPSGQVAVAYVFVGAGVTSITSAVVTDDRSLLPGVTGSDIVWPTAPWPQSTTAWSVVIVFAADAQTGADAATLMTIGGSNGLVENDISVVIGDTVPGDLRVGYDTASTTVSYFNNSQRWDDTKAHIVVVTLNADTKIRIYVDGDLATTSGALGDLAGFGHDSYSVGSYYQGQFGGTGFAPFRGLVSHLMTVDGVTITDQDVLDLYNAGTSGLAGEDTGARVNRLLDYAGWPTADRDIDTGSSILGGYDLSGQTLLDYLQLLDETERGLFFVGPDGKIVWRSRLGLLTQDVSRISQATFTDDVVGTPGAVGYQAVAAPFDETKVYTDAQVTRQGGAVQSYEDPTAIAKYGRRTYTATVMDATDNAVLDHAVWAVNRYKDAVLRIEQLTIKPRSNPATIWPLILAMDIGHRITFVRTPQGIGSAISVDLMVEGITHTITADDWTTVLKCSPAETIRYWIVDDDLGTYSANSTLDSIFVGL